MKASTKLLILNVIECALIASLPVMLLAFNQEHAILGNMDEVESDFWILSVIVTLALAFILGRATAKPKS